MNNLPTNAVHLDPYQGFVDTNKELNLRFGFHIGAVNSLLRNPDRCEILKQQMIYSVPNTPVWVNGLINNRGVLIPVINIKAHFPVLSSTDAGNQTLVALGTGSDAFATFIDGLPVTIDLDQEELILNSEMPSSTPEIIKKHVLKTYQSRNKDWHEIDYQGLVKNLFEYAHRD